MCIFFYTRPQFIPFNLIKRIPCNADRILLKNEVLLYEQRRIKTDLKSKETKVKYKAEK